MQAQIFLLTILFSFSIWSDWDDTNNLIDLQYFPDEGRFVLDSSLYRLGRAYDVNDTTTGTKSQEIDDNQIEVSETLQFSVVDGFALGLTVSYQMFRTVENNNFTSNIETDSDSSGLKEPDLFLRFRFLRQEEYSFYWDMKASFSPGFVNGKEATSEEDGNALRGGIQMGLSTQLGQKYSIFSWMADIGLNYAGTRTLERADTGVEQRELSSRFDFYLGMNLQVAMADILRISGRFYYLYYGQEDDTNILQSPNVVDTTDAYSDILFGAGLDFEIIEDFLAIGVDIDYTFGGDQTLNTTENVDRWELLTGVNLVIQI